MSRWKNRGFEKVVMYRWKNRGLGIMHIDERIGGLKGYRWKNRGLEDYVQMKE